MTNRSASKQSGKENVSKARPLKDCSFQVLRSEMILCYPILCKIFSNSFGTGMRGRNERTLE